ncbi:hypothetical protein Tco_0721567 [Tanacetum coccineum]
MRLVFIGNHLKFKSVPGEQNVRPTDPPYPGSVQCFWWIRGCSWDKICHFVISSSAFGGSVGGAGTKFVFDGALSTILKLRESAVRFCDPIQSIADNTLQVVGAKAMVVSIDIVRGLTGSEDDTETSFLVLSRLIGERKSEQQEDLRRALKALLTDYEKELSYSSGFVCSAQLLASLNVKTLAIPDADEVGSIWTKKYWFEKIPDVEVVYGYASSCYMEIMYHHRQMRFSKEVFKI